MIIVGYSIVSKVYRLFDTKSARVIERRNVLFDETNFPGGENKKRIQNSFCSIVLKTSLKKN